MDRQISELGAEGQTLTQSCRQLDAGEPNGFIWASLHCEKNNNLQQGLVHLHCTWKEFWVHVLCVKPLFSELKELNSSLTTDEMMSEIQELKTECAGHRARLEKIKSATNHVTPAEKEKVGGFTCVGNISDTLLTHCR